MINTRAVKLQNGHGSKIVFHNDLMDFDYDNKAMICYANKPLHFDSNIFNVNIKTGKIEVKSKYSNDGEVQVVFLSIVVVNERKKLEIIVSCGELALKIEESLLIYDNIYMKRF